MIQRRLALLLLAPVLAAAGAVSLLRYLLLLMFDPVSAWRVAIGFDQLANAATGGCEDETISSRANRARLSDRRWGCILCRLLDWIDRDHCRRSAGV